MAPNFKDDQVSICKDNQMLPVKSYATPFTDEGHGKDSNNMNTNFETSNNNARFISLAEAREKARTFENNVEYHPLCNHSYKLDRYSKNIMVIIHDNTYGSNVAAEDLKRAFEKYRFEIEIYPSMPADKVKTFTAEFFKRDFTEYGAVAFAVLGPITTIPKTQVTRCRRENVAVNTINTREYVSTKSPYSSEDILQYFSWTSVPPTLKLKPKIFIGQMSLVQNQSIHYNPQIKASFGEYTGLDLIELWMDDQPLRLLCDKLEALGDQESFQEITDKVMEETVKLCRERKSGDCRKWGLLSPLSERVPINFLRNTES